MLLAIPAAAWGVVAGWLAPGAAAVALLGIGRDPLERFVLAIAVGRILLAVVSLAAVSSVGAWAIHVWAGLGVLAWWFTRSRAASTDRVAIPGIGFAIAAAAAATCLLVVAVVARGGLPGADGSLVFFGRDSTTDPLVYASLALQLHETGLPVIYPFMSAATTTTTYLPYGVMVGLHALGAPMLDVVMRIAPLADMLALAVTAIALVRALGGGALAAGIGGVLVVLGGDPSFWLRPIGGVLGLDVLPLDTWSFFGPYLFAFNPVTAGLQLAFSAFVLIAAVGRGESRETKRRAVVAGLLVACLFETKLFLWAPVLGGLVLLAWRGAPAVIAQPVRWAAFVAVAGSAPFLVEKLAWARALAGRDLTAFQTCLGCVPRYLAEASLGSHDLSFRSFELFHWSLLGDPGILAETVGAIVLVGLVALGARAMALPTLWRGARSADAGLAFLYRWAALSSLLGLGASLVFTTRPHYLNGLQFAWIATGALWPFVALAVQRWFEDRTIPAVLVALALTVPGAWHCVSALGFGAPELHRVAADEVAFMSRIRAAVPPDGVVLEPSALTHPEFPSPVTWRAGRSVYLSLLSASKVMPEGERLRRGLQLETIFASDDRHAALDAIAASGARWVYAPAAAPLRFPPAPELEEVAAGPGGALYRLVR